MNANTCESSGRAVNTHRLYTVKGQPNSFASCDFDWCRPLTISGNLKLNYLLALTSCSIFACVLPKEHLHCHCVPLSPHLGFPSASLWKAKLGKNLKTINYSPSQILSCHLRLLFMLSSILVSVISSSKSSSSLKVMMDDSRDWKTVQSKKSQGIMKDL